MSSLGSSDLPTRARITHRALHSSRATVQLRRHRGTRHNRRDEPSMPYGSAARRLYSRTHRGNSREFIAAARGGGRVDRRRAQGKVRRCHGDLHLRNICLLDGKPTLFDCLEFSEALGCIDVLYDLAFLLMDLEHRGLTDFANLVLNRYLDVTDEDDGLPVMPAFL